QFDRHPHQSDVVCDQCQVHRKHQHLIHRMVEAHERRRQSSDLEFVADIAGAENAGGETDEAGQNDKRAVEIVDQQISTGSRIDKKQRQGAEEGEPGRGDIRASGYAVVRQCREQRRRNSRNSQYAGERIKRHCRSPRKSLMICTSTVSNRSRMRNRKMPITIKAIKIEKAMLISTTSGMPLAPAAASTNPFSSDMKPTT